MLQACSRPGETPRVAIRAMQVEGQDLLLTVDPQSLQTRLAHAACWTCATTSAEDQTTTRFLTAVDHLSQQPGKALGAGANWLDNAGLVHGRGQGVFITGDLCPSHKPLERAFLQSLEQPGEATPVALSVSGLWIERHEDDFRWLRRQKAENRLAITFVNHSYTHPYRPGTPDGRNYLLEPGVNVEHEILDVERLLIANGETPSVFFRFPGLISDGVLMQAVRAAHLIPLGADAWLALSPQARPGSIILVHPNGNEPAGLRLFERLRQQGALPQPFRPLIEAP